MAAPRKAFQTSRPHLRTASFPSLRTSLTPLNRPGTARLFVISASCSRSACIAPQRRVCTRQPDPASHQRTMPLAGDGRIHLPCNLRHEYLVWQSRLNKDRIYSIKHRNFAEPAPRYPGESPRILTPATPHPAWADYPRFAPAMPPMLDVSGDPSSPSPAIVGAKPPCCAFASSVLRRDQRHRAVEPDAQHVLVLGQRNIGPAVLEPCAVAPNPRQDRLPRARMQAHGAGQRK